MVDGPVIKGKKMKEIIIERGIAGSCIHIFTDVSGLSKNRKDSFLLLALEETKIKYYQLNK
jgi:hypothetical protein